MHGHSNDQDNGIVSQTIHSDLRLENKIAWAEALGGSSLMPMVRWVVMSEWGAWLTGASTCRCFPVIRKVLSDAGRPNFGSGPLACYSLLSCLSVLAAGCHLTSFELVGCHISQLTSRSSEPTAANLHTLLPPFSSISHTTFIFLPANYISKTAHM